MTLTTHAVIGAVIVSKFPNHPVLGFFLAFGSHFILDAIPHWDYPMRSYKEDAADKLNSRMPIGRDFYLDLFRVGGDFFIGLFVSLIIFSSLGHISTWWLTLVGVAGGVAPDFLQFLYWEIRKEPLTTLQRFHIWIHTKNKMKNLAMVSMLSQIVLVWLVIYLNML